MTAKQTSQRPSALLPTAVLSDPWWAYQFDAAVCLFGLIAENALQETLDVGTDDAPRRIPKYTLKQLLTPGFVIEREDREPTVTDNFGAMDGIQYREISG